MITQQWNAIKCCLTLIDGYMFTILATSMDTVCTDKRDVEIKKLFGANLSSYKNTVLNLNACKNCLRNIAPYPNFSEKE